jgi:hypothetical protein
VIVLLWVFGLPAFFALSIGLVLLVAGQWVLGLALLAASGIVFGSLELGHRLAMRA